MKRSMCRTMVKVAIESLGRALAANGLAIPTRKRKQNRLDRLSLQHNFYLLHSLLNRPFLEYTLIDHVGLRGEHSTGLRSLKDSPLQSDRALKKASSSIGLGCWKACPSQVHFDRCYSCVIVGYRSCLATRRCSLNLFHPSQAHCLSDRRRTDTRCHNPSLPTSIDAAR